MKKYALGVHHLNIAYDAGNEPTYHRQVRESVVPLLDILFRHPSWCFTIEMSGFSIEFIGTHYPFVLQRLKDLIEQERVELICCSYSAQIWTCFSKYDFLKSLEINDEIFLKFGIKPSRIFFAQENFSGEGICELSELFDVIILKDDYYYYLHPRNEFELVPPYFQLGKMKVTVGWGHIMERLSDHFHSINNGDSSVTFDKNKELFNEAEKDSVTDADKQKLPGIDWMWYHIGSSERFSKPQIKPGHVATCWVDTLWLSEVENHLVSCEAKGFMFTGVKKFIDAVENSGFTPPPSKEMLDGSWNMNRSIGGFIWMGHYSSVHENDLVVRNHNWKSRTRLLACELLINKLQIQTQEFSNLIKQAWRYQALAETSDSTGWLPDSQEVQYSLYQSENVLNTVAKITSLLKFKLNLGSLIIDTQTEKILAPNFNLTKSLQKISYNELLITPPIFIGGDGVITYYSLSDNIQRINVDFIPHQKISGIQFNLETKFLEYSPALMDNRTVKYLLDKFNPEIISLFLPNGLIGINDDKFLIKHNEFTSIACRLNKLTNTINYEIWNSQPSKIHWEFTLFHGRVNDALKLANQINISPIVHL